MKHRSLQEQLAELLRTSQSAKPGGETQPRGTTGSSQKASSPASPTIPAAPQAINTRPPSLSPPPEDPLRKAQSTIAELNSKITELQHQLERANADRIKGNDELRDQRARVAKLEAENEALGRQVSAVKGERDQLDLDRRKVEKDERNTLELMLQAEALQKTLEAERKALATDRIALDQSRTAHASELLQLHTLIKLQQEVGASELELKKRQGEVEQREASLAEREHEFDGRALKIASDEDFASEHRKLERAHRALTKNFDTKTEELATALEKYSKASEALKKLKVEVNELTAANEDLRSTVGALERTNKRLSTAKATAERLATELQETLRLAPEVQIKSIDTVRWLTDGFDLDAQDIFDPKVLVVGEGPWDGDDFQSLLLDRAFEVYRDGYAEAIEVLIVGRSGWNEETLIHQIECRDGKRLRVYSQELFVIALMLGIDPLDSDDEDSLFRIVEGHPAFEFLLEQEFPWPEYQPGTGEGEFTQSGVDHSPLFELGYSVAKNRALSIQERRSILENAMANTNLPWVLSNEYMEEWGEAETRKRLHRIAWHIRMCARTHNQHDEAVAKWESDLLWLKKNYYKPFMRFTWPK